MEIDCEKELEILSRAMKDHFGYELRRNSRNSTVKGGTTRHAVGIVDPGNGRRRERFVLGCEGEEYPDCLWRLYGYMSEYGIRRRGGSRIALPPFSSAGELEMKLELMGR